MITKIIDDQDVEVQVVLQGDFGKDPDDVFALLNCHNHVDYVVVNLYPSNMRARLAKSILRDLGRYDVAVFVGENTASENTKVADYEFDYHLVNEDAVISIPNPYENILAGNKPTIIIVNSAMTDLANFFINSYNPQLHNIYQIVMQGGYEKERDGYITPNCAANNSFDFFAAQTCFDLIQEYKLPFVIITKQIAYDNPIPADTYFKLGKEAYSHPVTQYLEKASKKAIQSLYNKALLPPNDPGREGLPNDRDLNWFFNSIAKKPLPTITPNGEEIINYISDLNVYDVFTILYALNDGKKYDFEMQYLKDNFYEATAKPGIDYSTIIYEKSLHNLLN